MLYLKRHHASICENKISVLIILKFGANLIKSFGAACTQLEAYDLFLLVVTHAFSDCKFSFQSYKLSKKFSVLL